MFKHDENAEREQQGNFTISDDGQAEWAIRKIAEAKAEKEKMAEFYRTQQEAIAARCDQTIEYMQTLLFSYFTAMPHKITPTGIQKYTLPSAVLTLKPATVDYERDKDKLLAWAKANKPDYVKVTEEASWADVKAYIKSTGEIPDGVKPVEKPGGFEVKLNG